MAQSYTLSQLLLSVKRAVEQSLNGYYWITAETIDVKVAGRNGHCYLELVEKELQGNQPAAKVRASIWSNRFGYLNAKFIDATGSCIVSGIKVLVLVQVQMHPVYGLSLVIHDIDPSYTLGDLVRARQEVIEALKKRGILELNQSLQLPRLVQKLAVVSAPNAAGYGDFMHHLAQNNLGIHFYTAFFQAQMQGTDADSSIVQALHRIADTGFPFDAVVIIRGGGASTDLTAFDRFPLAEAVAQFPIPVLSGVGHERDKSVLDLVAHAAFKTPTAVADFLIQRAGNELNHLSQLRQTLNASTETLMLQTHHKQTQTEERLQRAVTLRQQQIALKAQQTEQRLRAAVQLNIGLHKERRNKVAAMPQRLSSALLRHNQRQVNTLKTIKQTLSKETNRQLEQQKQHLKHLTQLIEALHPQQILQKGFGIVRYKNKALLNSESLHLGDLLDITLAHGALIASVQSTDSSLEKIFFSETNNSEKGNI